MKDLFDRQREYDTVTSGRNDWLQMPLPTIYAPFEYLALYCIFLEIATHCSGIYSKIEINVMRVISDRRFIMEDFNNLTI